MNRGELTLSSQPVRSPGRFVGQPAGRPAKTTVAVNAMTPQTVSATTHVQNTSRREAGLRAATGPTGNQTVVARGNHRRGLRIGVKECARDEVDVIDGRGRASREPPNKAAWQMVEIDRCLATPTDPPHVPVEPRFDVAVVAQRALGEGDEIGHVRRSLAAGPERVAPWRALVAHDPPKLVVMGVGHVAETKRRRLCRTVSARLSADAASTAIDR